MVGAKLRDRKNAGTSGAGRDFNPDAGPKWALAEVDAETLATMCEDFRKEVFRKAGKADPGELNK